MELACQVTINGIERRCEPKYIAGVYATIKLTRHLYSIFESVEWQPTADSVIKFESF